MTSREVNSQGAFSYGGKVGFGKKSGERGGKNCLCNLTKGRGVHAVKNASTAFSITEYGKIGTKRSGRREEGGRKCVGGMCGKSRVP